MVLPSNFPAGAPAGDGGFPPLSPSAACEGRVRAGDRDCDRLLEESLGDRGGDLEHLLGGERLGGDRLGGERRGGDLRGERLLLCGEYCLGGERRGGERLLRGGERPPPWPRGGGERLERRGGGPRGSGERRLLSSLRIGGNGPWRGGVDEPR